MTEQMTDTEKMNAVFHVQEEDAPISPWDRDVATSLAREIGVELSDRHWEIVVFLRHHYDEFGSIEYARDLSGMLQQRFSEQGGRRYLYSLFPGGPISQGCSIAGLPVPKDSSDPSFGYSV
ncbi:MAG: TusE/DsrC/DsvC family sulfur relay protein [Gammaproteobacteria bacterium]|nr:TusE/DsrC/DsvC family sulfur relay protein [Gammaproteobacteria bacterium]